MANYEDLIPLDIKDAWRIDAPLQREQAGEQVWLQFSFENGGHASRSDYTPRGYTRPRLLSGPGRHLAALVQKSEVDYVRSEDYDRYVTAFEAANQLREVANGAKLGKPMLNRLRRSLTEVMTEVSLPLDVQLDRASSGAQLGANLLVAYSARVDDFNHMFAARPVDVIDKTPPGRLRKPTLIVAGKNNVPRLEPTNYTRMPGLFISVNLLK